MKLIDNRFRIDDTVYKELSSELYIVSDLLDGEIKRSLNLFLGENNKETIDYYIENYLDFKKIKHENILKNIDFYIVDSIDLKKVNTPIYYMLNEYIDWPLLSNYKNNLKFKDKLKIILDIMNVIDYIHSRGFLYRYLSPSNIFINEQLDIKLRDLGTIKDYIINSRYDNLTEEFLAPENLMNHHDIGKEVDYYSIAILMKYLLYEESAIDLEDIISLEKKVFIDEIILNLSDRDPKQRNIQLRKYIKDIIEEFNLNIYYDLVEERDQLYFNNTIVGREKELRKIVSIDKSINNGIKKYNGVLVSGKVGSGKSRLLEEIQYRLRMLGRKIYYFKFIGDNHLENILKAINYKVSQKIINRLKEEELSSKEKFEFFNGIKKHLGRESRDRIVYLIIDDIDQGDKSLISLINFLIFYLRNDRILFILSAIDSSSIKDKSVLNLQIENLNKEDIATVVRSILTINYIPKNFADFLHRESRGNLKYLEYIIKDLYNRKELFMSRKGYWKTKTRNYYDIYISPNKDDLIGSYLNSLGNKDLMLIQAMSVFKNKIDLSILLKIINLEEKETYEILERLKENRIIEYKSKNISNEYIFHNPEFKKVLYNGLTNEEKVFFHKKIGKDLCEKYFLGDNIEIKTLVYHLIQSEQKDKAIRLGLEETKKKKNIFNTYTISILEMLYNVIDDEKEKNLIKVLDKLVRIYFIKGDIEKSEYYLSRLYNMAEVQENIRYVLKADYYKANIYLRNGKLDIVEDMADEIYNIAKNNNIYDGLIPGLVIKTRLALSRNNLDIIPEVLKKAIDISKEFNISYHLDTVYNLFGVYYHFKGNISKSIKCFKKCIVSAEAEGDMIEAIRALNNLGNIYNSVYGDNNKGLKYFEKGYKIANEYGFIQASIIFSNNIGDIYLRDLQYEKALLYFERAREAAIDTGDTRGRLLSSINLGNIYIQTNQYSKLYDIYSFLKNFTSITPVLEKEVETAYYNFLGEFYGYIGFWNRGIKNLYKAKKKYEKNNLREFLIIKAQILELKYYNNGYYNECEIEEVLEDFIEAHTLNFRLKYIFRFGLIAYKKSDYKFLNKLWNKFQYLIEDKNKEKSEKITNDFQSIFKLILANDEIELMSIEKKSTGIKCQYIDLDYLYNFIMGEKWFKLREYDKSIIYILKALDILYKKIEFIKDNYIKYNIIKTRDGDILKEYLKKAIKYQYDKELEYTKLENTRYKDYRDYKEIDNIFKIFNEDELWSIKGFNKEKDNIKSLEDLLSKLGSNYRGNLNHILSFIRYKTLADKGSIIYFDDNEGEYSVISSISKGDQKIPNENLFVQANRSRTGIVVNRSLPYIEKTIYKEFLSKDSVAIICIPLLENKYKFIKDRRKNTLGNYHKGYMYLETNSYINQFNYKNLILLNKLSSLICLNIDNYELNWISTTDKLTGALTKKHFDYLMEEMMKERNEHRKQFSLLMLDIDDFKEINDNYGHLKGDRVLSLIGKELRNNIRDSDIVARYGGEEFILVLFNTTVDEGLKIGESIKTSIENKNIPDIDGNITVSIGLAQYPEHGQFSKELIEKADQALYEAKEIRGKNTILSWNLNIGENKDNVDRLAGIYTGNSIQDNKNISAILDIVEEIKKNKNVNEKIYKFLEIFLDVLEGEYASILKVEGNKFNILKARMRNKTKWEKEYKVNEQIIKRVIDSSEGEFSINWDNIEKLESVSNIPIWRSIMVIPIIKRGKIRNILYTSVPLKEKEFSFQDLNLGKLLSNIFIGNLE